MWESWYSVVLRDDGQFGLVAQDEVSAVKQDGPEHGVVLCVLAQLGCLDGLEQLHVHPHLVAPDVGLRVQVEGEVALEQVAKAAQERLVPVAMNAFSIRASKGLSTFCRTVLAARCLPAIAVSFSGLTDVELVFIILCV